MARKSAKSKALPPDLVAHARAVLERLLEQDPELAGRTQREQAELLGTTQASISNITREKDGIGATVLVSIATRGNMTCDRILRRPGWQLAVALDYHCGEEVNGDVVRSVRKKFPTAEMSPEKWWQKIEEALAEASPEVEEVTKGMQDFPAPRAPHVSTDTPPSEVARPRRKR